MSRPFRPRCRTKESQRRRPTVALEERIDEIVDRVDKARANHGRPASALEEI